MDMRDHADRLAVAATAGAALLVAGVVACSREPQDPGRAAFPAAIATDATRYVLQPAAIGDTARLVATLSAPPDTTLHLLHCNGAISWGLQRREATGWTNAWVAETNGCLSAPRVVPAGGAHAETLVIVSRALDPPLPGPVRSDVPPGTYRVVWFGVLTEFDVDRRPHGPELALERRVSAPFTIARGED